MTHRIVSSYLQPLSTLTMIQFHLAVRTQLSGCKTVLDIGSGAGSPMRYLSFERAVGVELDPLYMKQAKKRQTHHEYVQDDVRNITKHFKKKEFDACVAMDLIEHLTKKEGLKLITDMESLAKKKIMIFTPNGYMNQTDADHPLQDHQSGWTAQEMESLGFTVYGMLGPKSLRTDQHVLKGNKFLTGIISEIAQFVYVHDMPENAAAILCVKNVSSPE